jgi:hypothetical protein
MARATSRMRRSRRVPAKLRAYEKDHGQEQGDGADLEDLPSHAGDGRVHLPDVDGEADDVSPPSVSVAA